MSQLAKLIEAFKGCNGPFPYDDLTRILRGLGYALQKNSGGSQRRFMNNNGHIIRLHEPHPSKDVLPYVVRQVRENLEVSGAVMSTISYKGFQASVHFEDGVLFIKVLHINDLLIATCTDSSAVMQTLQELVDEYLKDCAEAGKQPEKPFSGSFNIRVTKALHRRIAMAASQEETTLNQWISNALTETLECSRITSRMDSIFGKKKEEIALLRLSAFSTGRVRGVSGIRGVSGRKVHYQPEANQMSKSPWAALHSNVRK